MMDSSRFYDISALPDDVFSLSNDAFFSMIQKLAGEQMVEILKIQLISSTQSLLRTNNIFEIFNINCPALSEIRKKACFQLDDGSFLVKSGLKNNADHLLNLLRARQQQLTLANSNDDECDDRNENEEKQALFDLVNAYPLLKSIVTWYEHNHSEDNDSEQSFLQPFITNIVSNLSKSKNLYRYNASVQRFAIALYVLGGKIAYEFVRINLPGALPNLVTLKTYISNSDSKFVEGEFRFNSLDNYLNSIDTKYVFGSEDCTGVIRKIKYDKDTNTFIGFSSPLSNGLPILKKFQTDSMEQLRNWFSIVEKAPLLNVHMVQPVASLDNQSSPILLSAYDVNSRYTSVDIIRRWSFMYEECNKKDIRMIGFSTGMFILTFSAISKYRNILFRL